MNAPAAELSFKQKRVSTRTSFAFGKTEFTYGLRNREGARELAADYMHIGLGHSRIQRRDRSGLGLGAVLLLIGAAMVWWQTRAGDLSLLSLAWLAPGVMLVALVLTRKISFTVIEVAGNPVHIIEDKRLPHIVAELEARRRQRVAELYGPLNLANDPQLEIRKIEWLVAQSILTREQADQQIAQVHSAHAPHSKA